MIVWLEKATATRKEQLIHIAKENRMAAIEQGDFIITQVEQLATYPELGRAGRKQGTRELVIAA